MILAIVCAHGAAICVTLAFLVEARAAVSGVRPPPWTTLKLFALGVALLAVGWAIPW